MRTGSFAADIVALIEAREQDCAEVNRPDPVVDFFETGIVIVGRIGEVQQPGLKANRAGIGDAFDEEVARIFQRGESRWIRPRRRRVVRAGRCPAVMTVRPFLVVLVPECVERALLGAGVGPGGLIAPRFNVRCRRSWAPFSCGDAG